MKFLSFLLLIILVSCSKSTSCTSAIKGKLKNYTGLDGCGWVIEANDKVYEPVNLNEFDSTLLDENQAIYFTYESFQGGSICMVGEMIQLTCVEKR